MVVRNFISVWKIKNINLIFLWFKHLTFFFEKNKEKNANELHFINTCTYTNFVECNSTYETTFFFISECIETLNR